jgi:Family of unknown function (DUF6544)
MLPLLVGEIALATGLILFIASLHWRRSSEEIAARLGGQPFETAAVFSSEDLTELPEPVARYFRHVLGEGQPLIGTAELTQEGEFRIGTDEKSWRPFRATHHAVSKPPGFMWDARILMMPFLPAYVRDTYVGGAGSMQGEILAVFRLIDVRDRPELDSGALLRYLAEAVWYPTALLPSQGVAWEAIDENTARATLGDSGTTVSLEFTINARGEITNSFSSGRFREVDGNYVATPWAGRYGVYEENQGIRIPTEAEVEWCLPEGALPYWRGRIVAARYES